MAIPAEIEGSKKNRSDHSRDSFSVDKADESLRFYNYTAETPRPHISFARFFYYHFFLVWGFSFAIYPLLAYTIYRGRYELLVAYLGLIVYTYGPWKRRRERWQLFFFLNCPQYFKESSYRILEPGAWPELAPIMSKLEEGTEVKWDFDEIVQEMRGVPVKPRIWLCHPHGFLASCWGQQAFNPYFPDMLNCVASILYYFGALVICYSSHLGNPAAVTKSSICSILASGQSLAIIPGGFEEATITPLQGDRIYLSERNGIFKYALQYGADLVPYFGFGEARMHRNLQGCWKLRFWLCQHYMPAILPWGRFAWIPLQDSCQHIVVGKPLTVKKHEGVITASDIGQLKERYIEEVQRIYSTYADRFYGGKDTHKLEIW